MTLDRFTQRRMTRAMEQGDPAEIARALKHRRDGASVAAMPDEIELFVPYLADSTNVGTRSHWRARKRTVDVCNTAVRAVVRRAGLQPIAGRVDITMIPVLGKGTRTRDTSNYSLNVKHIEDGLVRAGLLPDDRSEYVRNVIMTPPIRDWQRGDGTLVYLTPVPNEAPDHV